MTDSEDYYDALAGGAPRNPHSFGAIKGREERVRMHGGRTTPPSNEIDVALDKLHFGEGGLIFAIPISIGLFAALARPVLERLEEIIDTINIDGSLISIFAAAAVYQCARRVGLGRSKSARIMAPLAALVIGGAGGMAAVSELRTIGYPLPKLSRSDSASATGRHLIAHRLAKRIEADAYRSIRKALTIIVATDTRCQQSSCVIEQPSITVDRDPVRQFSTTSAKMTVRAWPNRASGDSDTIAIGELRYDVASSYGSIGSFTWLHYYFDPATPLAKLDTMPELKISAKMLSDCRLGKAKRIELDPNDQRSLLCGISGSNIGHLIYKATRPLDARTRLTALHHQ